MPFQRVWNDSCPYTYDQWEADGVSYVIQDLPPEDDEEALKVLVENQLPDATLSLTCGILEDPVSIESLIYCWRSYISKRTSLACYATINDKRTLAALNICAVQCQGEIDKRPEKGEGWRNKNNVDDYFEDKMDPFKYLGLDKLLRTLGLVVRREYRGTGLGARVLSAREPLCRLLGIKGSCSLFTGPGSQKSAERAGFTTAYEATFRELADAGLKFPRDDRVIKLMVVKYK